MTKESPKNQVRQFKPEVCRKEMLMDPPLASIIIPCFNEQGFIATCLDSIIENDYPQDKLNVLVVDGMSTDSTRAIIQEYTRKYPFIRMLDNPKKFKPRAMNIGIQEANGSIILIMSAHAMMASDYISESVKHLCETDADNVGGILKTLPRDNSVIAKTIAYSISHPFAAGNATHRTGSKTTRWVDTVFGGCYRKEVFDRIGLFDETLIRGQDRELNIRLRRFGGKILLVPGIVSYYFARNSFIGFSRWMFIAGLTPFYVSKITGQAIFSWRNFVPPVFVLALLSSLIGSWVIPSLIWLFTGIILVYLIFAFYFSIPITWKEKDIRFMLTMPLIFATTHILYGLGALVGIVKKVERQAEWSKV